MCPHPGCGKKFYLSNHLRRHMIIHSGQAQGTGQGQAGSNPGGAALLRAASLSFTWAGVRWRKYSA